MSFVQATDGTAPMGFEAKYKWASIGSRFSFILALSEWPDLEDYEFLEGTLLLALRTIKRGAEARKSRFTGFDDIPAPIPQP